MGCGRIARQVHLPTLARLRGVDVLAVVDNEPASLEAARKLVPRAAAVDEIDTGLRVPGVEAVLVCLPSALHATVARTVFERSLHMYLEKPIATTAAEADDVVARWRVAGTVGATGFNYRFRDDVKAARTKLATGGIGRVVLVRSLFATDAAQVPRWKEAPEGGGAALVDLAIHHLDLVPFLLGEALTVEGCVEQSVRRPGDTVSVALRSSTGIPVSVAATSAARAVDVIEIYGTEGVLRVERDVRPGRRERSFERALATFVDVCRGGDAHELADLDDGRSALQLALTARRLSADSSRA